DPVAQRGLHDVHRQLIDHVVVLASELGMRAHPHHDVEVAGRAAPVSSRSLADQADLGPGVDAAGDLDPEPAALLDPTLPVADVAGGAENPSLASTGRAARDVDDRAEDRLRLPPDLPRATAGRACFDPGPGLGAGAETALAGRQSRHLDLLVDTLEGLLEGDREVVSKVVASHR